MYGYALKQCKSLQVLASFDSVSFLEKPDT